MPDLSAEGVRKYWSKHPDLDKAAAILTLENLESLTLKDNPELEKKVVQLGKELDNVGEIDLKQNATIIVLAANLSSSRMLRLLEACEDVYPGTIAKLIHRASQSDTPVSRLFVKRCLGLGSMLAMKEQEALPAR